ncbi:hypothetical protein [Streptomyces sp. NPDC054784]
MDTVKLELAAQRHKEAAAALTAAESDLRDEAVAALRQDPDAAPDARGADVAEVARVTGWTEEQIALLVRAAGSR